MKAQIFMKKKILLLYFSGAGATRLVARLMKEYLKADCMIDCFPVEKIDSPDLKSYDAMIIGTPVYHGAPSQLITGFFEDLAPLDQPLKAFVYNTRALASCNTNRILAKTLEEKNILAIMYREYRSPASDGVLLAPFVHRFFTFEKELEEHIRQDCQDFLALLEHDHNSHFIPRLRLSGILNAANKLAGQLTTFSVYLHKEQCTRCGRCVKDCPHQALAEGADRYPVFDRKHCENCLRCIHHCPAKALSLSKRRRPKKVLKY